MFGKRIYFYVYIAILNNNRRDGDPGRMDGEVPALAAQVLGRQRKVPLLRRKRRDGSEKGEPLSKVLPTRDRNPARGRFGGLAV